MDIWETQRGALLTHLLKMCDGPRWFLGPQLALGALILFYVTMCT